MKRETPDLDLRLCREVADQCAAIQLRRAARTVDRLYDEVRKPSGLTGAQFALLVALALAGTPKVTALAQILGLDHSTLSRTLKTSERGGLLRVSDGVDRRTRSVSLTPAGRLRLNKALQSWQEAQAAFLKRFGTSRWKEVSGHLHALEQQFGSH
jgi:DNA-binding MarR family transcriptional regulator